MRNLKRLLTMVMAIAMMMSLMVVGAGAAFKDQDKIENTDAVNMNVALGIINGRDDGSFDPAGNVTRAEMAKMICVLLNGGKAPTLSAKATPVFTDIKGHWGEGYIEYCASLGIIAGMGDGTFAPDKSVTPTQAAKMLLVALGYDAAFEGFNGASWSVKIGVAANQKDLYDDLAIDPNAALNRDDAAQMIWNALQADQVKYEYSLTTVNGQLMNIQKREDKTGDKAALLADKFGTFDTDNTTAIMTGVTYNSTSEKYTYSFNAYDKDGNLVAAKYPSFTTKLDFTKLYGHNVCVVAKATDNVYGMYADDSTVLFSGIIDDIDYADATKTSGASVEVKDKDYDLGKNAKTVAYNGDISAAKKIADVKADGAPVYVKAEAIDNTDDGKIDLIVYYPVTWGQITYAGKDYIRVDSVSGQLDFDDYKVYTGAAKDDYVMIDKNGLVDDVVTKLDEVNGKLTNIAGSTVTIDGKKYDQTALTDKLTSGNINDTFKFVAINGYLVKQSASDVVNLDEILLVANVATGTNANGGTDAKVYFKDGTSKVVSIKSDSAAAVKNTTYKYEISKGEYRLTALNSTTNKFGFDFADQNNAGITGAWKEKTSDYATINGNRIADNAIVLAQDGTTSTYNLITGAKLSKVTSDTVKVYSYGVEKNDTTGFNVVTFAVVTGTTSATTDRNYGFIMSNVEESKNADKETIYTFQMWNGKAEVPMTTKAGTTPSGTLEKGVLISYSLNGDKIDDIIALGSSNAVYGAVLATDGKYVDVLTDAKGTVVKYKVDTTDTTLLYISKADKNGDATGNIVKADKSDVATAFRSIAGEYYTANVLVLGTGSGTITADLIAMDVDNDIKAPATVTSTLSANVATGETVIATGDLDVTKAVTVNGTLIVKGTLTGASNITVSATGTLVLDKTASVANLRAITPANGAILILGSASSDKYTTDTVKFFTSIGTSTAGHPAVEVLVTPDTKIPAGTYTYGTLGYDNAGAKNVTGWFK